MRAHRFTANGTRLCWADATDEQRIAVRDRAREYPGAFTGFQSFGIGKVFNGMRQPMQPAAVLAIVKLAVRLLCAINKSIGIEHADNRVVRAIQPIDPIEVGVHDFNAGDATLADCIGQARCAQIGNVRGNVNWG